MARRHGDKSRYAAQLPAVAGGLEANRLGEVDQQLWVFLHKGMQIAERNSMKTSSDEFLGMNRYLIHSGFRRRILIAETLVFKIIDGHCGVPRCASADEPAHRSDLPNLHRPLCPTRLLEPICAPGRRLLCVLSEHWDRRRPGRPAAPYLRFLLKR